MNQPIEYVFLAVAVLLLLSLLASKLSTRVGVPALLLFLILGMLSGPGGPGGIQFDNPYVAQMLGIGALIFILYSGALDTNWSHVREIAWSAASLSTIAVVFTTVLVGVFVYFCLDFSLMESFLIGAIVSSTDAAAVFSILRTRKMRLKTRVQTTIEVESASNDPIAVLFTVLFMQVLTTPTVSILDLLGLLFSQVAIGLAFGWMMGNVIPWVINKVRLGQQGLYPVLTVALVLFTYGITASLGGSGFIAVYLAGLFVGRQHFVHKTELMHFHEGLTWLMQIAMFLTLGLLVYPAQLVGVIWVDLLVALFLIFLARPISVFIALLFSSFNIREKAMISWVGLRGAVPIILATFPLMAHLPKAVEIFNLVFFIVLTSVLIQGTLVPVVAKWLKLRE